MKYERDRHQFPLLLNEWNLLGEGVEVGVCRGIHAEQILSLWPGTLHLVDPWAKVEGYEEEYDHAANLKETRERMAPYKGRYYLLRTSSVKAAGKFYDGALDFVYLDANHTYEAVKADLEVWWPKVKPGGMLAGDDYGLVDEQWVDFGHGRTRFGVKRAVDEWAHKVRRNISLDILADWKNRLPDGTEIQARGWWTIK